MHRFNHGLAGRALQNLTHDHLGQLVEGVTGDVCTQIAAGNVLVFAELAPIFTELLHACGSKPANAAQLAAAVTPGLALLGSAADAASAATAFESYGRALFAPIDRATLILQANIVAVTHEQRRLQPAISGALNAAISNTLKRLIEDDIVRHLPTAAAPVMPSMADRRSLQGPRRGLGHGADRIDHAPHRQRDVRSPARRAAAAQGVFPSGLRDLTGTAAEDAFAQWDKTSGTGKPTGARDWACPPESARRTTTRTPQEPSHPPNLRPPRPERQADRQDSR